MIDSDLHPYIQKALARPARWLADHGCDANMITLIGAAMALPAFAALVFHAYMIALFFILLNRFCDGLDGVVARYQKKGPTDFGGYLDIVSDFIFYSGVVFFFALGQPDTALAAAFLMLSFIGTGTSFLAYAIIVEKRKSYPGVNPAAKSGTTQKKSFHHAGGVMEGFETILLFIGICTMPDAFVPMALLFGVFSWATTIGRILQARAQFSTMPKTTPKTIREKPAP
jgi:phosphatidylglycerophosphate synthase